MLLVGDAAVVIFLCEISNKVCFIKRKFPEGGSSEGLVVLGADGPAGRPSNPSLRPFVLRLRSNGALSSWR